MGFPSGPVVRNPELSLLRAQVQSLVRELKSHKWTAGGKKEKTNLAMSPTLTARSLSLASSALCRMPFSFLPLFTNLPTVSVSIHATLRLLHSCLILLRTYALGCSVPFSGFLFHLVIQANLCINTFLSTEVPPTFLKLSPSNLGIITTTGRG